MNDGGDRGKGGFDVFISYSRIDVRLARVHRSFIKCPRSLLTSGLSPDE
jgi:hypothetical protein